MPRRLKLSPLQRDTMVTLEEASAETPQRLTVATSKVPQLRESPQETQPMIPAHDRSGLHVFAGTWQSPTNL